MKRLFHHILFLFTALLIGNQLYANTTKATDAYSDLGTSYQASPELAFDFGPISDFIQIEWMLIGTGVILLIIAIMFGRNKVLLEAGKPMLKREG